MKEHFLEEVAFAVGLGGSAGFFQAGNQGGYKIDNRPCIQIFFDHPLPVASRAESQPQSGPGRSQFIRTTSQGSRFRRPGSLHAAGEWWCANRKSRVSDPKAVARYTRLPP